MKWECLKISRFELKILYNLTKLRHEPTGFKLIHRIYITVLLKIEFMQMQLGQCWNTCCLRSTLTAGICYECVPYFPAARSSRPPFSCSRPVSSPEYQVTPFLRPPRSTHAEQHGTPVCLIALHSTVLSYSSSLRESTYSRHRSLK